MQVGVGSLVGRHYGERICGMLGLEARDTADLELLPLWASAWVYEYPRHIAKHGDHVAGEWVYVYGWRPLRAWLFARAVFWVMLWRQE